MTIQELGTILQSHVAVKIIILNNNFLGMVRQWQELFFDKRYSATEIVNPNFTAIAKAYSIEAERVDNPQVLSTAMDKMLEHQGAYLLEVIVEKEENVFPMVPQGASVAEIRLK
jgi:acetolactate synthase-1/2/3 large subunit